MSLLKSFKIISCVLIIAFMFGGCMSTTHLKDLMVVEGIGVDKNEDKIGLSVQTLKAGLVSGGEAPSGNMTMNTDEEGKTIFDAVSNLSQNLSKRIFFGHNKLIIFGKEICESDFENQLDYFLRSTDSRVDVAVCISKTTAKETIESKEDDCNIPCEHIAKLLNNGQNSGSSAYVTTNELLNVYSDKTSDIYLPVIEKQKDRDNVTAVGIGIFQDDKLKYITNSEETKGLLFIRGKLKNCSIEFDDTQLGKIGVEIYNPKVCNRVEIVDGALKFKSEIEVQIIVNEIENGIATDMTTDTMDKIADKTEREIEAICRRAFRVCNENGSDCLRVGEYLAKDHPKSYEMLSDEWDKYYKTVKYSVDVKSYLKEISDNTQAD